MSLLGRVTLIMGLLITFISLVLGFGLMFHGGYDDWAEFFFMAVPLGFLVTFAGLSTIVLFSTESDRK
jgi:ABC-type dipeptide/oligopeptide/nickel transport system permease subunit